MQDFLKDLHKVTNYITTQLSSLSEKQRETVDAQLRDTDYPKGAQSFSSTSVRTIRKLGRAYNNDPTDQQEVDYSSVYKLVLSFVSEGALQPIIVGVQGGTEYIVSGRHRTLAFAYLSYLNHGDGFLDQTVDVVVVDYHVNAQLDQVVIGANDTRRVRPTERNQMKLSKAGLSSIESLDKRPSKVLLKGLIAREVLDSYEGDLTPVTVQKISDKFVQAFYDHTVFKLSATPEPSELATLSRYCTEFGEWLGNITEQLYRDYGNVARYAGDVQTKYHDDISGLLEELAEVEELVEDTVEEVEVVKSAAPPTDTIDFDVIEL